MALSKMDIENVLLNEISGCIGVLCMHIRDGTLTNAAQHDFRDRLSRGIAEAIVRAAREGVKPE